MNYKRCFYCGGTNLRADRSLAGKIICGDCGRPISSNFRNQRLSKNPFLNSNFSRILIFTILFIVIIKILS